MHTRLLEHERLLDNLRYRELFTAHGDNKNHMSLVMAFSTNQIAELICVTVIDQ